eukprot:COSAG01_NODE_12703_length_1695_cov_2.201502_2_plen_187_part_00
MLLSGGGGAGAEAQGGRGVAAIRPPALAGVCLCHACPCHESELARRPGRHRRPSAGAASAGRRSGRWRRSSAWRVRQRPLRWPDQKTLEGSTDKRDRVCCAAAIAAARVKDAVLEETQRRAALAQQIKAEEARQRAAISQDYARRAKRRCDGRAVLPARWNGSGRWGVLPSLPPPPKSRADGGWRD